MNKYYKILILTATAFTLMIGAPFFKTPCDCELTLPLAFTGSILGCGGDKEYAQQSDVNEKSIAVAAETEKIVGIKVTFIELGSVNCIPCKMMRPVIEKVEKNYPGQVKVVFHDVWTDRGKSEGYKFGVRVIPTQIFLDKTGREYFRHEGFFPFEEVDKILKQKGVN